MDEQWSLFEARRLLRRVVYLESTIKDLSHTVTQNTAAIAALDRRPALPGKLSARLLAPPGPRRSSSAPGRSCTSQPQPGPSPLAKKLLQAPPHHGPQQPSVPQPSQQQQQVQVQGRRRQAAPGAQRPASAAPHPAAPPPRRASSPGRAPRAASFTFTSPFIDFHNNLDVALHISVSPTPSVLLLTTLGLWEAPVTAPVDPHPGHPYQSYPYRRSPPTPTPAPPPQSTTMLRVVLPKTSVSVSLPGSLQAGFLSVVADAPWAKGRYMVLKQDFAVYHRETVTVLPQQHADDARGPLASPPAAAEHPVSRASFLVAPGSN